MLFDSNSDGFVDREELRVMLTALYTVCDNPNPLPQRATQSGGAAQASKLMQSSASVAPLGALRPRAGTRTITLFNRLTQSDGAMLPTELAQTHNLTLSGGAVHAPEPAREKPPPIAIEPEKEKIEQDHSSEVAFFVDMLFKKADVTKDGLLSPDEFREAALLHPFILKTFNLDHQQNYDVRISMG